MATVDEDKSTATCVTGISLTDSDLYERAQTVYLHFTEWREKTFAGFVGLLVLISAGYGWTVANMPRVQWLLPAIGAIASFVMLLLDMRTRWLINVAEETASALEQQDDKRETVGLFSALQSNDRPTFSHGNVLFATYIGSLLMLTLATITVSLCPLESTSPKPANDAAGAVRLQPSVPGSETPLVTAKPDSGSVNK